MKRRQFIALLGGAAAPALLSPYIARAQQSAMPVIGFLNPSSSDSYGDRLRAFHQALKGTGYAEGENVTLEYRWADNEADRLPGLAAELQRRRVAVIVASGNAAALAAKAATAAIPIVFNVSEDPVGMGLVTSLARPGGNLTGVNFFNAELAAKRLELLRELVPKAVRLGVLVNPTAPVAATTVREMEAAARGKAMQTQILRATTSGEINAAFETLMLERADALYVDGGFLFTSRRVQLVLLAARHSIPTSYSDREYVESGGLMSYGSDTSDTWRQMGLYAGRILKGAKPADLPVVQSSKFDLVLNAETARLLRLTVPPSLLAIADKVIE